MDTSLQRRLADIEAKCAVPRNPAPLGKKIISEVQRRQLAGLDIRRSLDSTIDSVRSNSSQVSQDSLFCTPSRNKDEPRGSRKERFFDRVNQRKAQQAKIEHDLGPYQPNVVFKPPRVNIDDSEIEDEDEAKENVEERGGGEATLEQDSIDQSVQQQENANQTVELADESVNQTAETVDQSVTEPQNAPQELDDGVALFAGSQGRKGQGCSTPRNINNTLAPLRQIDVSAVALDDTVPGARSEKESSVEPEPMEVDEPTMVDDVFNQFRGSQKEHPSTQKDETDRRAGSKEDRAPPVEEDAARDTRVVRRNPEKEMPVERPPNDTFSIHGGGDSLANGGGTFTVEKNNENGTFTVEKNKENGTFTGEKNAANGTFAVEKNGPFTVPKAIPARPEPHERPGPSKTKAPTTEVQAPAEPVAVDVPGPSKAPIPEKKKRTGLDSLVQNLSATMPSPGRKTYGFNQLRPFKQSRIRSKTPTRARRISVAGEKSIEMSDISQASVDAEDPSNFDSLLEPNTDQTTPKRPPSRLGPSRPASRNSMTPVAKMKPFVGPNYAKPTIASQKRAAFQEEEEAENTLSPFNPIDPEQMMVHNNMKSGYRPRKTDASRLAINRLNETTRSRFADEAIVNRRRAFLERRANQSVHQPAVVDAPMVVVEAPPAVEVVPPAPVAAAPTDETIEQLNHSANNLDINDAEERDREESRRDVPVRHEPHAEVSAQAGLLLERENRMVRGHSRVEDNTVGSTLRVEQSLVRPDPPPMDFDDFPGGAYDNDDDDTELIVRRPKAGLLSDSIASEAPMTPARFKHNIKHRLISEEDSMAEEPLSSGSVEMVMKPRKVVVPESPEEEGLRRSKRNRMAPVRTWMGEQPLYQNSPSGGVRLVGSSKVVVRDPEFVKAGTTNPVKVVERQKKGIAKKHKRRERRESSD